MYEKKFDIASDRVKELAEQEEEIKWITKKKRKQSPSSNSNNVRICNINAAYG